jgi:hypothetical protein
MIRPCRVPITANGNGVPDSAQFKWPHIAPNDRVIILGRSGTGKTVLAQKLLLLVRNAIIVDTKMNDPGWDAVGEEVLARKIYKTGAGRWWWKPSDEFLADEDNAEQFFAWCYRRNGRRVVYLDELLDVAPRANSFPVSLKLLATRGRSAGVGLWSTTQRPVDVPKFALTEANHYFVFYLSDDDDQKTAQKMAGAHFDFARIKGNFGFYYIDAKGNVFGPSVITLDEAPAPLTVSSEKGSTPTAA